MASVSDLETALKSLLCQEHGFSYVRHHRLCTGSPRYGMAITSLPVSWKPLSSCHHEGVHPRPYFKSKVEASTRIFMLVHARPIPGGHPRGRAVGLVPVG